MWVERWKSLWAMFCCGTVGDICIFGLLYGGLALQALPPGTLFDCPFDFWGFCFSSPCCHGLTFFRAVVWGFPEPEINISCPVWWSVWTA